jgi:ketol-acid reductoisomerase
MSTVYHDDAANPAVIRGQSVAILGYGNQGSAQARNLRDSGVDVVVGNIDDSYREEALAEGFEVVSIAEASACADILFLLTPDEIMPEIYQKDVAPHLAAGNLLNFAHGYNIGFGLIVPPPSVDVVFIAPRMIGAGVRDSYLSGEGFASFVGVHQDATGKAKERMLALAHALGSTRAGCLEMTMKQEATLDLFTEQAFGPAFGRVLQASVEILVEAGYPPEAVMMELFLSGEMAYSFLKTRDIGSIEQSKLHSHTSQYGSLTRSQRYADLVPLLQEKMKATIEEIESGAFAKEWSSNREKGLAMLEKAREFRKDVPMMRWEEATRRAFRIGDAVDEEQG